MKKYEYLTHKRYNSTHSPEIQLSSYGEDGWLLTAVRTIPRENGVDEFEYIFVREKQGE